MRLFLRVLPAAALVALPLAAQTPGRPAADELTRALQKKYDGIRDLTADFVHTYEGGVLRQRTTERGRVFIKKPGKMRWEYRVPEEKLFVSDGRRLYSYIPADRQVIVGSMPAEDQATTPMLFLAGAGNLLRDFTVAYADRRPAPPDRYVLTLTPKQSEPEVEWLTLVVDRGTLRILQLATRDWQGGTSTLTFTNLQENPRLSDRLFSFSIPSGVDVITSGTPSR